MWADLVGDSLVGLAFYVGVVVEVVEGVVEVVGGFKVAGRMGVPAGRLLVNGMPLQIFQEVSPNPPKRYLYLC